MTTKREVTKFLVWQAYHKLKEEIGDIPTQAMVAESLGLSREWISDIAKDLKTCKFPNRGGINRGENDTRFTRYQPPVDKFISRGVDKVIIGDM